MGKNIKGLTFGTLVASLLVAGSALASGTSGSAPSVPKAHWGYSGSEGPSNWGKLSTAYALCSSGHQQSPVNITKPQHAGMATFDIDYRSTPLNIVNNGHTIQVNIAPGSSMTVGHRKYQLLQFHFHTPSENIVSGQAYPMEVHFVHKDQDGNLGVLGVFFKQGAENLALGEIWSKMPTSVNAVQAHKKIAVNALDLVPDNRDYYRFLGSLTTPPCSEGVQWHVAKTPIEASAGQISKFTSLIGQNARPVQQLGHRLLIDSSAGSGGSAH